MKDDFSEYGNDNPDNIVICDSCKLPFNKWDEGSTDHPELCDDCYAALKAFGKLKNRISTVRFFRW